MFSSLRYFWSEAFKSLFRNQFMAIACTYRNCIYVHTGRFSLRSVKYQPHGILP